MEPIQETADLSAYLAADDVIDHGHPSVREAAARLRQHSVGPHDYAAAAFELVRDGIPHSFDAAPDAVRNPDSDAGPESGGEHVVTWRASDVLARRTGICHAKSHALTALLRTAGIPAGLCYQRLTADDGSQPVVHGLVALLLPGRDRWARLDPRGDKKGVRTSFSLDEERLAWVPRPELGECDYPLVYAVPPRPVMAALHGAATLAELAALLPTGLPDAGASPGRGPLSA